MCRSRSVVKKMIQFDSNHQTTNEPLNMLTIKHQGGWDPKTNIIPTSVISQIDQAFANVELALKDSGVQAGWKAVFRVNSYHVGLEGKQEEMLGRMVENMKKYMPDHEPIWTCVGVPALGEPEMKVEIEVVAFDEK